MAASGAASVKGGNWQIFDKFVEVSGANIFLNTKVDFSPNDVPLIVC